MSDIRSGYLVRGIRHTEEESLLAHTYWIFDRFVTYFHIVTLTIELINDTDIPIVSD
jgi:hypothetical protein